MSPARTQVPTRLRLPRHAATSRHLMSAYPFQAQPGLPGRGVYLGADLLSGGSFAYDPWALYPATLTNPNALVVGNVGSGKSTLVKIYLHRQVGVFGRQAFVVDPKGEYAAVADALGMATVRLSPGGRVRLNPLDPGPLGDDDPVAVARRRAEMVANLAAAGLDRRLRPEERAGIDTAVGELDARGVGQPVLSDVVDALLAPTGDMAARLRTSQVALAQAVREVALELRRLLSGDLAGMFDGPTTVPVVWSGRGLVLDLSAVFGSEALSLVMLCATSWLQAVLASHGGPRRIVVLDEAWAVLRDLGSARCLQASYKLSRSYGVSNVAVVHRLSDLRAQGADGSEAVKLAQGLLADTETRVIFAQPASEVATATDLLGLTDTEAELLTRLRRGRALWKVGRHSAVVDHVVGPTERALVDTDARMAAR
ncbi:MAG TPA: hypothetical protein VFH45_10990 [Acidimicrobiales bacterium]|nr:hypothetical protein [Acidimicrobiales bacterium]